MAEEYFHLTGSDPAIGEHHLVIDDGEIVSYDPDDAVIVATLPYAERIAATMKYMTPRARYRVTERCLQHALHVANPELQCPGQ